MPPFGMKKMALKSDARLNSDKNGPSGLIVIPSKILRPYGSKLCVYLKTMTQIYLNTTGVETNANI